MYPEYRHIQMTKSIDVNAHEQPQFLESLERGMSVFKCYSSSDLILTNDEISERLNLPKPTVSRITYTLTSLGYLTYIKRLGAYQLGPSVLAMAKPLLNPTGFRQVIRGSLQELAIDLGVTVSLTAAAGRNMVYLDTFRGNNPFVIGLSVGAAIPMLVTASGRVYLSCLPVTKRKLLIQEINKHEDKTSLGKKESLEKALIDIKELGYCTSIGEWHPDVNAVAVPVCLKEHGDIFVIVCGGASTNLTPVLIKKKFGPRLVTFSKELISSYDI